MGTTKAVRFTVHLEHGLHQALRMKSAQSLRSMSEIVNAALRQRLREDEDDLAAVQSRANELALGHEEFLAELKAGGD